MKKTLQCTLIFIVSTTLSGTVKDSLQNPLSYANVIAKPKDVSKNLQFAITDNEGYYKLILQEGDTITISISYLGYKPIDYTFIALKSATKNFTLQQSSEQLEEVIIEMPVTVRGDTTIYKTSKFIDGTERKLKNVLKKLVNMSLVPFFPKLACTPISSEIPKTTNLICSLSNIFLKLSLSANKHFSPSLISPFLNEMLSFI